MPRFVSGFGLGRYPHSGSNYSAPESGTRRHELTTTVNLGVPNVLVTDGYFVFDLLKFKRTFNPAIADTPPTADASNNFQTVTVFNGSRVENYKANISLKNNSTSVPSCLDVYEVCLSYYDAFIWNSIFPTACPVTFSQVANLEGEVDLKAMVTSLVATNQIKNFKFLQHYIQYRGQIDFEAIGGNTSVQIDINRVPPKCARSQTGMYWGLFFKNNPSKNASQSINITAAKEFSFDEIPSDRRLPFIE